MWWLYVLACTSMMMAPGARSMSLGTKRPPYYTPRYGGGSSYDYGGGGFGSDYEPPFSVPGQIFDGVTITKLLQSAGDLWNAADVLEGASLACRRIGPDIGAYLAKVGADPVVDAICDYFETADVEEDCGELWDILVASAGRPDLVDGSLALVPDLRCRDGDYDYPSDYIFPSFMNMSFSAYDFPEIQKRAALDDINPGDLNPYDPCSESGIEKVNNILFALMDWFGPSLFEAFYSGGSEPYSICSLMRYVLSMDVDDMIQNLIGVLKFPLADIMETIQPLDVCSLISEIDDQTALEVVGVLKDLLVGFSDLNEDQLCAFLAEEQTREAYLGEAETMITNLLTPDEGRCNDVLSIVAPHDQLGYFYIVTGFDVSSEDERNNFCAAYIEAYSASSTYVPTPYVLPPDVDINSITPFQTPGEFLPGLTFVELLQLDGAGYNSEKVIDAIAVTCDVFEDFAASMVEAEQFDVRGFCLGARNRALGIMEAFCLAEIVPNSYYGDDRPLGLRPFNPAPVALYAFHEISGIDDISKEEICSAADDILDERSARDIVVEVIDIFLTEALPAINGVCENWEATLCYWKPFCPVPEPATEVPEDVTDGPSWYYNYVPYIPDPEYIERANADFDRISDGLASIAWQIAGFEGRQETCAFVADAIDPLSGRGDRAAAEVLRGQILGVVAEVDRCSQIIETALGLISEEDRPYILRGGSTNIFYQITGYETSGEFCEAIAESFSNGGIPLATPPPGPGGQPIANINIVANIVVYLQRVARSL